ncbi:hypothetical protein [Yoonia sp.]|uniref:hypothetical protein n=1 Tax=Yoonia sp. TaxID=2212373 RepID=UPI0025EDF9B1|nr:hypothetical protein [Yoonia sp.]
MADKDAAMVDDIVRQMPAMFAANPVVGPPVAHFWQAQEKMLQDAEAFSAHWFRRRQDATKLALDTARDVRTNGGSEPSALIEAMQDWQQHAVERIAEDFREWASLCARCAGHVASVDVAAETEAAKKTSNRATAPTARHATPV